MRESSQEKLSKIIEEHGTITGECNLLRRLTTPELGIKYSEIKEDPNKLVGKTITSRGFLATSEREGGAESFLGLKVKFTNIQNTKGLDINKQEGLHPSLENRRKLEQEILFNKGTKYKITKVEPIKDKEGDIYDFDIEAEIIG